MNEFKNLIEQIYICDKISKSSENIVSVKLCSFLMNYFWGIQKASGDSDLLDKILMHKPIKMDNFDMMFKFFCEWFEEEGSLCIDKVIKNLDAEKVDSRFDSFIQVYSKYIKAAFDNDNQEVLLEFLYRIPDKMIRDFERFNFLSYEECKIIANMTIQDLDISELQEKSYEFYINLLEPDICQASNI